MAEWLEKRSGRLAKAEVFDVAAAGTERARSAFGGQSREQPLDAALATAAAIAGTGQPRDFLYSLRVTLVNRPNDTRRRHLIAVANQRVRRFRPHLRRHLQYRSHRVKAPNSSAKIDAMASYFLRLSHNCRYSRK